MNIFVLDIDAATAAEYQCDKHVVKMVLETAQLLCSPFESGIAPYKRTHFNHPCAQWTRESEANFDWLIIHGLALAIEFELRFGKEHKSKAVIDWCMSNKHLLLFPKQQATPFVQAMPDIYKSPNVVEAYRNYYMGAKSSIAAWNKGRSKPDWFR